jgi:hypothetical protein
MLTPQANLPLGDMPGDYVFDFAISFAAPERSIAEQLARSLSDRQCHVFYDGAYKSRLLGKQLDTEFKWIYGGGTRFFVPIVSRAYAERAWPQLEWAIARQEAARRGAEFILPVRVDDTILLGLADRIGYMDLREHSIAEVCETLAGKLPGAAFSGWGRPERWVATFGVNVVELLERRVLPAEAPQAYPALCDWLEKDLFHRLKSARIDNVEPAEASSRTRETLSVRVSFTWTPTTPLEFPNLNCWEVLEVLPWYEVYENDPSPAT